MEGFKQSANPGYTAQFFNTTEMSTGRQMAIAPVSFSFDPTGIFAKDLISYTQNQNCWFKEKHDIALGTANNLSELFPFFSAYTHIDGVGHFMDGGGNDNSGTKTLKFIYQKYRMRWTANLPMIHQKTTGSCHLHQ
ncbi:MAG: hypothetical protein HWD63_10385 [Candidatus Parvibacillus calidus]|nr:MAG: hypothetical protein HWD63_10385 [Candidatus Parvibacillus calidus]